MAGLYRLESGRGPSSCRVSELSLERGDDLPMTPTPPPKSKAARLRAAEDEAEIERADAELLAALREKLRDYELSSIPTIIDENKDLREWAERAEERLTVVELKWSEERDLRIKARAEVERLRALSESPSARTEGT